MAKNIKYSVTHPDGTVDTRSSARSYTHVIVAVPATQAARRTALNKLADEAIQRAEQFEAAADAGEVKAAYRGMGIDKTSFHAFEFGLVGTWTRGSGRGPGYFLINDRGNSEGLTDTWRKYAEGVEVVRELEPNEYDREPKIVVKVRDYLIHKAREQAAKAREAAAKYREDAETPDPKGYAALRWSSRRDLAEKALSEFEYEYTTGRTLKIVEVD